MRKKRKLKARAEEAVAIAEELAQPEVAEALEAREVERELADEAAADRDGDVAADSADSDEAVWAEGGDGDGADAEASGEGEGDSERPAGLEPAQLKRVIESLLFAADRPLAMRDLKHLCGLRSGDAIQVAIDELTADYQDRGVVLHDVAGGWQFRTSPTASAYVQRLVVGRPVRLSRAQLETLAIIAYRQPITRPEIDEIRGVDTGSTLKVLLDRSLIRVLGKKEEPGRPLLYGTTREFLEFFHLKELRELPTLREFHELSEDSMREVERLDDDARDARDDDDGEAGDGGAGSDGSGGDMSGDGAGGGDASGGDAGDWAADGSSGDADQTAEMAAELVAIDDTLGERGVVAEDHSS